MPEVTYSTPEPWYLKNLPNFKLLDLNSVMNDITLHVNLRNLSAAMLQAGALGKEYNSTGAFFFASPNFFIADLYEMQQGFEDEYSAWLVSTNLDEQLKLKNLTTLAFLLARCEGYTELSAEVIQEALPNLCTLIVLESKHRKGLAWVDYKQFSLFDAKVHKLGNLLKQKEQPEKGNDENGTAPA